MRPVVLVSVLVSWVQMLFLANAQLGPCRVALDLGGGPMVGEHGSYKVTNSRHPEAIITLILVHNQITNRSVVLQLPQRLARQVPI